ncbi:hypothetical protein, partial [Kitasatospora sp. NPDC058478]|uniref:hypothetical protein n=1 Tax=Kitasatospora sp. NPDC058478 TaxID=3346520 RepID=UPI00365DA379
AGGGRPPPRARGPLTPPPAGAPPRAPPRLVTGTAQVLEGLLTLGLVEQARGLDGLLGLLLPDIAPGPQRDAALFLAGASAATSSAARRWRGGGWNPTELADVAEQLHTAGYELMARRARRALGAAALLGDPAARDRP